MRIITIVTLIYLPATFVSTFFGTDVIKYQSGANFSQEAMYRWLQVSFPLTAVTLVAAGFFFHLSSRRLQEDRKKIPKTRLDLQGRAAHVYTASGS